MAKLNLTPRTWRGLLKLREFLTDCEGKFLRFDEDQLFYELYLKLVPRKIALEIIKRQMGGKKTALVANNFPYTKTLKCLPNIKHYCLWSIKGRLSEKDIKNHVLKKIKRGPWFYMERKVYAKTVPEIWHCHVFVRVRPLSV
ncbi:hypothetical protein HY502_02850 [Candidatus Woesebacteria bacterium]|nr:hypothetical protein [Candidatus Woesebacteria bacterium]